MQNKVCTSQIFSSNLIIKNKKMIKSITLFSCLILFSSCSKIQEKIESFTKTSTSSPQVDNDGKTKNIEEDYKSLEGTPFTFDNSVCSRKLFGSDIIKVLSDYEFSPSNGGQYPHISRLNEGGYLEVNEQAGGELYFGNMKVSANGEFVYFDAYTQDWMSKAYNRTHVKIKLTPIQIENYPFQIEIEIEQYGKLVIKKTLTIVVPSESYTTSGC